MAKYINPPFLSPAELKAHLQKYARQNRRKPHLWTVHTDLPVFKWAVKTGSEWYPPRVIVNLIVPKGAILRADAATWVDVCASRKMRASRAVVHSVAGPTGAAWPRAVSNYDRTTLYQPGVVVKPKWGFSRYDMECADGIHFYLELRSALGIAQRR